MDYLDASEEQVTFEVPQKAHARTPKNYSVVTYWGNLDAFAAVQEPFVRDVGAEPFIWKRSYGKVKEATCHVQFQKYTDASRRGSSDISSSLLGPVLDSYWCDCQSADVYKSTVKDQLTTWMESLESRSVVHDWVIIVLVRPDSKKSPRSKLTPRLEVFERINNDFCTKLKDRGRCLYVFDSRNGMGDAEVWHSAIQRFRQFIFDAYETKLRAYEERVRIARDERNKPEWKLSEYFCLRETLANAYQRLDFPEEGLLHLDELDALITQFVAEAAQDSAIPAHKQQCSIVPVDWLSFGLNSSSKSTSKLHQLVQSGTVSLLEMRTFLFVRQFELLGELNRTWEITMRAIPFIQKINQECRLFKVQLISGALDSWTFLACHEIREISQSCGDGASPLNLQNHSTLLGLEREKLSRLGTLCGLMPHQKPTPEQTDLVTVLSRAIEGSHPSAAVLKLYDALASAEKFMKNFLELSEMTMGTFKHVGRTRAARLLGVELAKYYMELKLFDKASGFLLDALKVLKDECWSLPTGIIASLYTECATATQQWDQVVKSALLVASCQDMDEASRLKHLEIFKNVIATKDLSSRTIVGCRNIFFPTATNARIQRSCQTVFANQEHTVTVMLQSNLLGTVRIEACQLLAKLSDSSTTGLHRPARRMTSSPSWEYDFFFMERMDSRGYENYLPCVSTFPKDETVSMDSTALLKYFPGVICGEARAGSLNPSKLMAQNDPMDLREPSKSDLSLPSDTQEIVPGLNKLVFRKRLNRCGVYRITQLRFKHSNTLQFALPLDDLPLIEVVPEPPLCQLNPARHDDRLWMFTEYAFNLSLTGNNLANLDDVIFSVHCDDGTHVKLASSNGSPLPENNTLLCSNQHKFQFLVTCHSSSSNFDAKIYVTFPWNTKPLLFSYKFFTFLTITGSAHYCAPLMFLSLAVTNQWTEPVAVQNATLVTDDNQVLEEVTKTAEHFKLDHKSSMHLIWKANQQLKGPATLMFQSQYSPLSKARMFPLSIPVVVGVFGQMRIRVLLDSPVMNYSNYVIGDSVKIVYHILVADVPDAAPLVYYQIKYDAGFWTSVDETSGSVNLMESQDILLNCSVVAIRTGKTRLPMLRLLYLNNEDILPVDSFHVYNESTCRTVAIRTKDPGYAPSSDQLPNE